MKKGVNNKKGFSLVEIMLAVSIFALSVMGLSGGLFYGQMAGITASHRNQAVFYANEGLDATRNIAFDSFGNLVNGSFGLVILDNSYDFAGSSEFLDIFERQIIISDIDANTKKVTSKVSWQGGVMDEGEVILITYITNWK